MNPRVIRAMATLVACVTAYASSAVGVANAKPPRHDLSAAEAAAAIVRADGSPVQMSKRVKIDGATAAFGSGQMVLEDATGAVSRVGGLEVFDSPGIDFALRATEDGAQALSVMADSAAPNKSAYRFPGLFLTQEANGVVAVRKGSLTGEPVGVIDRAWAKDAQGVAVPTWYEISGDRLVQHVAPTANSAYPVVADPRVRTAWYGASVDFKYSETKRLARFSGGCTAYAGLVTGVAGLVGAVEVAAVTGLVTGGCGAVQWMSETAYEDGNCISIKVVVAISLVTPWITKCYSKK